MKRYFNKIWKTIEMMQDYTLYLMKVGVKTKLYIVLFVAALPFVVMAQPVEGNRTTDKRTPGNAGSYTFSHTQDAGGDGHLIVITRYPSNGKATAVKYNGVALTKKVEYTMNSGGHWIAFWELNDPATGANNVQVTHASQHSSVHVTAMSFTNSDGIGVTGNNGNGGWATQRTINLTVAENSMIVGTGWTTGNAPDVFKISGVSPGLDWSITGSRWDYGGISAALSAGAHAYVAKDNGGHIFMAGFEVLNISCVAQTATAGSALAAICQSATSAAMGGSTGGSATGGTWSGGAGTWTNATDPANATYTAGAAESGSVTLTLTSTGGCNAAATDTKNITVNANPTATAGSALSDICQSATSAAMGGSVGGGATGGTWSGGAGTWSNASNPSTATYTAGAAESGAITLTLTTSGGDCGTTTDTKNITVDANPTVSAGGALADICQGATSAAMGGSIGGGATGGTWSGGAGTWTNASNPATATYTAGAAESGSITLTLTTSGGDCGTTTDTKNITVDANPTATAGAALADICQGATSAAMGGSVGGGATGGTWSGGAGTWANASNPSTATYTAGAAESGSITLTLTTSGGDCGTTTDTKNITVDANPTATAGGALADICQGATSAAMGGSIGGGATGGTWSGGAGTWTNASNPATATYTAGGAESGSITLTLTTSGGDCGTTTDTKNITVDANPTASAGAALADICQSGTSAAMGGSVGGGATGGTWSGGAGTWTNASNPSTATYTAGAAESGSITLTLTTSGGDCGTTTDTKNINVDATSVGGSIANAATECYGDNSATLTLSGHTGSITKWEKNENGAGWTDVANTTTTEAYTNLIITTQYRAVVQSGSCSSATSSDVTVTVNKQIDPGTIEW